MNNISSSVKVVCCSYCIQIIIGAPIQIGILLQSQMTQLYLVCLTMRVAMVLF